MNQRYLIAIIILAGIGSIGSVLAYSGTISAGQGNFNNVLVTGTCTGCGGGEGSFTSYNTVSLNTTVGSFGGTNFPRIIVNNMGTVVFSDSNANYVVTISGTTLFNNSTIGSSGNQELSQSINGIYQIVNNDNVPKVSIFKNNIYLQDLGINLSQFSNPFGKLGMAISPDGHYIAVIGEDSGVSSDRLLIFRGS